MNARTEERVEGWQSRPFSGGYGGLRELADETYSGVVETDEGAWLCMLNGKAIGVFDGQIEDFEDATGTAYDAPHPGVPLLFAMQERGGTLEEQYYTKDTPISEADGTLSSGSFVGYIELSENVISGDYYVCYYAGRSMSVAFVGNNDRLVTGEEAFEKADDEVGIYDVYSVDVEVIEIPDGADASGGGTGAAGATAGGVGASESGPGGAPAADRPGDERRVDDGATADDRSPAERDRSPADRDHPAAPTGGDRAGATDEGTAGPDREDADPLGEDPAREEPGRPGTADDAREDRRSTDDPREDRQAADHARDRRPGAADEGGDGDRRDAGSDRTGSAYESERDEDVSEVDEILYGEATGPRSLDEGTGESGDPSTTDEGTPGDRRSDAGEDREGTEAVADGADVESGREDRDPAAGPRESAGNADAGGRGRQFEDEAAWREDDSVPSLDDGEAGDGTGAVEGLADEVRAHDETIEELKEQLAIVKRQHDQFEREHDRIDDDAEEIRQQVTRLVSRFRDLSERTDRIEARIDDLAARVEEMDRAPAQGPEGHRDRAAGGRGRPDAGTAPGEPQGEPAGGTDRAGPGGAEPTDAGSGGAPPADAGPGGSADPEKSLSTEQALRETNLLVRYDSKGKPTLEAAHGGDVDPDPVNANLRIDTHTSFDERGTTVEGQPFDAFLRERIEYQFAEWLVRDLVYEIRDTGNASALGDLYDAIPEIDRIEMASAVEVPGEEEGTTERVEFDVVVRNKSGRPLAVANFNDSRDPATREMVVDLEEGARKLCIGTGLRAAFLVTKSFFDPAALETVEEATGGSLLSRDSKRSYVRLSRKQGYHLCLVESRGGDFHLNVPEL